MDTIDLISKISGTKADETAITLAARYFGWTAKITITQPVLDENGNPTYVDNLIQFPILETVEIDNPETASEFIEKKFATDFQQAVYNQRKNDDEKEIEEEIAVLRDRLVAEKEAERSDISNDLIIEKNA